MICGRCVGFIFSCLLIRIAVRWSGMRLRRVTDDNGFTFMYGERGQPSPDYPSMLLLHGFSADHFMWAPIVHVCSYFTIFC